MVTMKLLATFITSVLICTGAVEDSVLRVLPAPPQPYLHSLEVPGHGVLDLQPSESLFHEKYFVKHFDPNTNAELVQYPSRSKHCYYHGRLRHDQASVSAASYCDGALDAYIKNTEESLHIRCKVGSKCQIMRLHEDIAPDQDVKNLRFSKRSLLALVNAYEPLRNEPRRYVELYVVNDHAQFLANNKSVDDVQKRSETIMNIMNAVYQPLRIEVVLVGVEVWSSGDKITVDSNSHRTLGSFSEYRQKSISPLHEHDHAEFITGIRFTDGAIGKAYKRTMCSWKYSTGVAMDKGGNPAYVTTTIAHEMGHSFGLEHDEDLKYCQCQEARCIMSSTSVYNRLFTYWSTCSVKGILHAWDIGLDTCLHNRPATTFGSEAGPQCGNGRLERGEECDCGPADHCTNPCCDPTTCSMRVNATCATGDCCDLELCAPKAAATMCRRPLGECDLPEFCDGDGSSCPADYHRRDGAPCDSRASGRCWKGTCAGRDAACRRIWGSDARSSVDFCYTKFNAIGNSRGACNFDIQTDSYVACNPSARDDLQCGMLNCDNTGTVVFNAGMNLRSHLPRDVVRLSGREHYCQRVMFDTMPPVRNPGLVPDGAGCGGGGGGRVCLNSTCRPAPHSPQCAAADCGGRGVCNSVGQCHCEVGWGGSACASPGPGGSRVSGPASVFVDHRGRLALIIGLLSFGAVIAVAVTIICYCYRYRLKSCYLRLVMMCTMPRRARAGISAKSLRQKTGLTVIDMNTTGGPRVQQQQPATRTTAVPPPIAHVPPLVRNPRPSEISHGHLKTTAPSAPDEGFYDRPPKSKARPVISAPRPSLQTIQTANSNLSRQASLNRGARPPIPPAPSLSGRSAGGRVSPSVVRRSETIAAAPSGAARAALRAANYSAANTTDSSPASPLLRSVSLASATAPLRSSSAADRPARPPPPGRPAAGAAAAQKPSDPVLKHTTAAATGQAESGGADCGHSNEGLTGSDSSISVRERAQMFQNIVPLQNGLSRP